MTADELVAFAEDLARAAAAGGGAKALAEILARRAHAGVLVEDGEWRHLAAAGAGLPSSVRPLLDGGATGEGEYRPLLDGGATGEGEYRPLRDGYSGRTLSITAGGTRVGQISVFGEGDLAALEHLVRLTAGVIAVELARGPHGGSGRKRAFWERLSSNAYHDAIAARDDAAARGIALAPEYVAIALEAEPLEGAPAAEQDTLRNAALDAMRGVEGEIGLLERGTTLLLFAPVAREIDASNARTAASLLPRALAKKQPHLRVGGGVGTRVPFVSLRQSIDEAHAALTISRRLYGAGRVAAYEELGAYPLLLHGGDAGQLRAFSERTLAPLRTYDEKHQTELERTLRLYFGVGENVKTAAAQLNVHRHTVFYRLRQIGEICGCALDDAHDQLTLRMAIAIDALTNERL